MNTLKRILIFGAGGFIGSELFRILRGDPAYEVFGVVSPRGVSDEGEGLQSADITDIQSVRNVYAAIRPDLVINAAGRAHHRETDAVEELFAVNVEGTANLVRVASEIGVKNFIHLSSVMVYGHHRAAEIDETAQTNPIGLYAESKLLGEGAAAKLADAGQVNLTILRLAMVPAAKNYSNLRDLAEALSAGRFRWVGSGENCKSMLTMDDLIGALRTVIDSSDQRNASGIFNLSSGSVPMKDVIETLSKGLGVSIPRSRIPEAAARLAAILFGGSFGIPTTERLTKFLSDDRISAKRFSELQGFRFEGDVLQAILEYARQHKVSATPDA